MISASPYSGDVVLEASIERVDQELRVAYSLQNLFSRAIGVYDGATGDPEQEWPDLTSFVYISLESREAVAVKRVAAPPPQGRRIDTLRLPPASRLNPDETKSVKFSLPLPLVERSEYFPAHQNAAWRDGEVSVVRLTIGFQRAEEGAQFQPLAENPNLYKLASGFSFQEYVSAEQALTVPVRARIDQPFERV